MGVSLRKASQSRPYWNDNADLKTDCVADVRELAEIFPELVESGESLLIECRVGYQIEKYIPQTFDAPAEGGWPYDFMVVVCQVWGVNDDGEMLLLDTDAATEQKLAAYIRAEKQEWLGEVCSV